MNPVNELVSTVSRDMRNNITYSCQVSQCLCPPLWWPLPSWPCAAQSSFSYKRWPLDSHAVSQLYNTFSCQSQCEI